MKQGRHICNTLKAIRRQIAEANDIKYEPRECHHEGDCAGTCPACEAEVRYLEGEIGRQRSMGKKVAVAGIAMGLVGMAACTTFNAKDSTPASQQTSTEDSTLASQQTSTSESSMMGERTMGEVVEPMPHFPGGDEALEDYLKTNIRYPQVKDTLDGRVVISFVVERDGSITNAEVVKSLAPAYDAEALRVVSAMPKWVHEGGFTVKIRYAIPITFRRK
jgi:TonB family protein